MTVKEATRIMLQQIKAKKTEANNYVPVKNKDLALALNLTAASYSRILTGVTTPQIQTWAKICKMHSLICGHEKTMAITDKIDV